MEIITYHYYNDSLPIITNWVTYVKYVFSRCTHTVGTRETFSVCTVVDAGCFYLASLVLFLLSAPDFPLGTPLPLPHGVML